MLTHTSTRSSSGTHSLWSLADDLVRRALDNTTSLGQLSADAHKVGVDVTRGLAAFVDAPVFKCGLAAETTLK